MDITARSLVDLISRLKKQGETDAEIKKSFNKYLDIQARQNRIPLRGEFELTPLCNLDCKMCYVHLDSSQFDKAHLLSVETWKKLIDEAHKAGMIYSSLTGGECLTYPGFDDIYLYLRSKGSVPSIASNGLLIDNKRIDFFRKYPPNHIQVTLYGSSDDAYEKVTGHRVFHTIYHNLQLLRESHLKVFIVITPSIYMSDDIRPLLETAISLGFPFGINANLITPRENTGRQLGDLEIDQYITIYKTLKELEQRELLPVDPVELPDENASGEEAFGLQCGAGRSSFNIQYNGKMAPCPSLADVTTEPLRDGFINAWHRLNDLVSQYPIPAECKGCAYYDYCMHCAAIHNNAGKPGHRNPRICERTKKLIQEGFIQMLDNSRKGIT